MNGPEAEMDFQAFTAAVKERLEAAYPDRRIEAGTVEKNNGLRLTGLTVWREGSPVSPTLYLDGFYAAYLGGRPLGDIVERVKTCYEEHKDVPGFELPRLSDFEAVKNIICFQLVNRERNRGRLAGIPHREFLDLAVIYYIPVSFGGGASARITVQKGFLKIWGVDEGTLYHYAEANTCRLFPVRLQPMKEVAAELARELSLPLNAAALESPLSVLRCEGGGAAALIYGSGLKRFAEASGDFYILPSSVHEAMLCPLFPGLAGKEDMLEMVREINAKEIAADEVLSDNVYLYHADSGTIEVLE